MQLCDDGHEEICFETKKCPVCILIEKYEDKIEELNYEIESLKEE